MPAKSRPFLDIGADSEVTVTIQDPNPRERVDEKWGRSKFYYDVRHEGREKTITATQKLHETIQEQCGPLEPGMAISIEREGSSTATRWSASRVRGHNEPNPVAQARSDSRAVSAAASAAYGRTYQMVRDEYLTLLGDVRGHLIDSIGENFANEHAQAVAATIYIRCDREGIQFPFARGTEPEQQPATEDADERNAGEDSDDRLEKARLWARAMFMRAKVHPTQFDAVLGYMTGAPGLITFDNLALEQAQGLAEMTNNGKDLAPVHAAMEQLSEANEEFPADMPF